MVSSTLLASAVSQLPPNSYVPPSRQVSGKALVADIHLDVADVANALSSSSVGISVAGLDSLGHLPIANLPSLALNSSLSDVSTTNLQDGQCLIYSGSKWRNSSSRLADLTDVSLPQAPAVNQVLAYNGTAWTNTSQASGSAAFGTPQTAQGLEFFNGSAVVANTALQTDGAGRLAVNEASVNSAYNLSVSGSSARLALTDSLVLGAGDQTSSPGGLTIRGGN